MLGRGLLGVALLATAGLAPGCGSRAAPLPHVAEQNGRTLLLPARFGWVSSEHESGSLPSAIALGGKASGRVLLYLEFPELKEPRRLLRAELLLSASGAPGQAIDVELSAADPAHAELRSWSDQPRTASPYLAARLSTQGSPERLDVTEIFREKARSGQPLRLLLRAEPGAGEPLLVETGAAGGAAPRLEAYWE
jgi:hypothetical protein